MLVASSYPSFVKYMGSKSKIIDFVVEGINDVRSPGEAVLDLFSGSASLSGAIGRQVGFFSNDIQAYSCVLSRAYAWSWKGKDSPTAKTLIDRASNIVTDVRECVEDSIFSYGSDITLSEFNQAEVAQRELIGREFYHGWHLFLKNYSGTWWSAEQCMWIDAIREVAEEYRSDPVYDVILASLMFSMAYCSQGTGHYAQYRDAKSISSLKDILIYRRRDIASYFLRKYEEVFSCLCDSPRELDFGVTTKDYSVCLNEFQGGTVYADPPYCFVHYSRFYHALETLVLYDYPELQVKGGGVVKGRYRVERHQSPFSIASQVEGAFEKLFNGVRCSGSNLVLSYSNTGMIELDRMIGIATDIFGGKSLELLTMDHQHMTLGRTGVRHRDVKECLLLVK
ncbi:DNA adenine methylase [Pseudomonas aeruginosa]|uniref:DNA adenine methylase n=1 Tax=Pseudomonas aeruginosa TaxID=287 RepID=UPI000AED1C6A|nr:DNA adenine methylase [Pseudomonas aeruginosa]MCT1273512.1 DNA adenine methylase [Pseudomonas aeruginosa]VTQ97728.1 Modification methylase FokI [Pseudomonas aeruginosa]